MDSVSASNDGVLLPDLPVDVLIQIVEELEAWDIVSCQMVARAWHEAFTNSTFLRRVLKKYPLARGVRQISDAGVDANLTSMFGAVASRYYHMSKGKARKIVKHKLEPLEQYGYWYPIGQWDYHESQPGGRLYYENAATHLSRLGNKPYLFRPTLWSYDDGLLACSVPSTERQGDIDEQILSLLDVDTGKYFSTPFRRSGKIVRNLSLRNRALVVEWAERDPYHDLNASEKVHRHFATCYDIRLSKHNEWEVTFRNEWKIHFLGLPLDMRDRFFSTHNGTHYAVYVWQPNRSMYTGDEDMPIEALSVWDISKPSPYLPSGDPSGKCIPPEDKRPHLLARFSFRELDFLGVRQFANISLMSLHLDSEALSLTIKENICMAGQGYFDPAERLMQVVVTTFLFVGDGPPFRLECFGDLPPYRGHCSMESVEIENTERWFQPIMDVYDVDSDVRFSLVETCFTGRSLVNKIVLRVKSLDQWSTVDDDIVAQLAGMGRIAGDERWIVGQNGQMEIVVAKF